MASKTTKANYIIHIFSVLHALTVIILRNLGLADYVVLTLLTITMVVLITRLYDVPLEVTAALALLCCFAGFYMGTKGADIINVIGNKTIARYSNIITTFIVTEILGWITFFIIRKSRKRQ